MSEKHEWQVGDLCTCIYGGTGHGVIYRVIKIRKVSSQHWADTQQLEIVPVHGVMTSTKRRAKRNLAAGWCSFVSLIDLATEYAKFGTFISEEAKKRGSDGST